MGIHYFIQGLFVLVGLFVCTGSHLQLELVFHGTEHTVHREKRRTETGTLVLCPDWHTDDGNRNLFFLSIQGTV